MKTKHAWALNTFRALSQKWGKTGEVLDFFFICVTIFFFHYRWIWTIPNTFMTYTIRTH